MNPAAKNRLKNILSDNKSGSTDILLKLIKWSQDYSNEQRTLFEMIDIAKNKLKTFSTVQSFIREFKKFIAKNDKEKISRFLREQSAQIGNKYSYLFKNSLPFLKYCKRFVTLSNSKTIIEILKRLNERSNIFVTIGESRPQLEGRIMAKELLKHKINVEIIPDALLPDSVQKSDCVIVGADVVLSNNDVVNKIGSRSIAIACKYFKKPFYVLATSDKISRKIKYIPERRNEYEIWNYNHQLLKRTNYYFEVVENELITKIILDKIKIQK